MFNLKHIVYVSVFFFMFSQSNYCFSEPDGEKRCLLMFVEESIASEYQRSQEDIKAVELEEATKELQTIIENIAIDCERIYEYLKANQSNLSRVEQEKLYLMFEFLKSQLFIISWDKVLKKGEYVSFDNKKDSLYTKFEISKRKDLLSSMREEIDKFSELKESSLFVFKIWTNLINKYTSFYKLNRLKDKLGLLDRDIYTISLFSKNISDTDVVFQLIAYELYNRTQVIQKALPDFGKKFKSKTSYYSTSSFIQDNIIKDINYKLQRVINNLGKLEFATFMSNALDSPILEDIATTETEASTDRTFIIRFVSSYEDYLNMLNGEVIPEEFDGIDTSDLGKVLEVVKQEQWSEWIIDTMEAPSSLSTNVTDLIIAMYYWIELNSDKKTGSVFEKIYRDYKLEQRTNEVIYKEFSALDYSSKIDLLWYLIAEEKTFKNGFLFLTYFWGRYALGQTNLKEDKNLIQSFIFDKTYVITAKNNFVEDQIYHDKGVTLSVDQKKND